MILDKIVTATRQRVEDQMRFIPIDLLESLARDRNGTLDFKPAITRSADKEICFICEVKKASPSKGVIAQKFDFMQIAEDYEQAGASAISILTEPNYFLGNIKYLQRISEMSTIPTLQKDFIISEYQVYQAKISGASAVLLICAILSDKELERFIYLINFFRMNALVEAHDETEVKRAIDAGASIIGVNNRDLKTFEVDINTCIKLRKFVPSKILYVAESGIATREDVLKLIDADVDAALVGEVLMRQDDKKLALDTLRGLK